MGCLVRNDLQVQLDPHEKHMAAVCAFVTWHELCHEHKQPPTCTQPKPTGAHTCIRSQANHSNTCHAVVTTPQNCAHTCGTGFGPCNHHWWHAHSPCPLAPTHASVRNRITQTHVQQPYGPLETAHTHAVLCDPCNNQHAHSPCPLAPTQNRKCAFVHMPTAQTHTENVP
jgi:hypothetical protein